MFSAGERIGPYEIAGLLGAGGMGEVYRAQDRRLGREVAIKVLPAAFTTDPDRRARFEREARLLASLNHPNIATIHGIEEAAFPALVLELVDGPTLAERILRGPLPLAEALAIARQIADALDAAHEKNIIHRDLKPANIKITSDGRVKVLDFGLAKLASAGGAPDATQSPTVTVSGTHAGAIRGTIAYMSPEQARGLPVDKRTDIWAFGCVLYEMLTGRAPFLRQTTSDTIAAVLEREPDWESLPAAATAVRPLLHRCLEKDPRERLRDIGDARHDLVLARQVAVPVPLQATWRPWAYLLAAIVVAAAGVALFLMSARMVATRPSIGPMTQLTWDAGLSTQPSISADGRLVAYASDRAGGGNLDIWVQQTSGGPPIRLTSDDANDTNPDVSPDGSVVAFRSDRDPAGVYVVPALGGDARLVAPGGREPRFSPDGRTIAYWTGPWLAARSISMVRKIFTVPATGGDAVEVKTGLASAGDPVWASDGRLLVFGRRATSGPDVQTDWWLVSTDGSSAVRTGVYAQLDASGIDVAATDGQPYPAAWTNGVVLFAARRVGSDASSIWLIRIDSRTGRAEGPPIAVTDGTTVPHDAPTVSRDGRLVLASRTRQGVLVGVPLDADGGKEVGSPRLLRESGPSAGRAAISADGRLLVFYWTLLGTSELRARDLSTGKERLLAVTPVATLNPVVSDEGKWVAYTVTRTAVGGGSGPGDGYVLAIDGGSPRKICDNCQASAWLDEGRRLFVVDGESGAADLLDLAAGTRTRIVIGSPAIDRPLVSGDGRWLMFNEGGQAYLAAFNRSAPAPVEQRIPLIDGVRLVGRAAGWSPDGRLAYVLLESDGFRCLYAIRLDPSSGRPIGDPFAVHHFHDASMQWGSTGFGNAVARGLFLANLTQFRGNIWMTSIGDVPR